MKNRNILTILLVLTIIFTIMCGSFAYFTWQASEAEKTNVTFTVEKQFSCSADGGGNITGANLVPTDSCTGDKAIKRTIKSMPQITGIELLFFILIPDIRGLCVVVPTMTFMQVLFVICLELVMQKENVRSAQSYHTLHKKLTILSKYVIISSQVEEKFHKEGKIL